MSNIVLTFQYLQYDAYPRFTITLQVKSKRTLGSLEVKMDAITIGSYLVCTNAPQVKTPPESAPRISATGALQCVRLVLWWALPVCPWIRVVPVCPWIPRVPVCPWIGLCPGARASDRSRSPETTRLQAVAVCLLIPQTVCPHWGVLTVGVKAGAWSGCSSL